MTKKVLLINTEREGYGVLQVPVTMTVAQMRSLLESYPDDMEVYLGFDNGYTYGGVCEENFEVYTETEDEEEDD